MELEGNIMKTRNPKKVQQMTLEGRYTREEILKRTVDEIRERAHLTRNLKKYCRWN